MRKSLFYLFVLMAVVAIPLASCEKAQKPQGDEQSQHDPESDDDQIVIAGYDALEWFQSSIVVLDENGNIERRGYGEMLDPADTTILSVCVSDLKMAEEIFLS